MHLENSWHQLPIYYRRDTSCKHLVHEYNCEHTFPACLKSGLNFLFSYFRSALSCQAKQIKVHFKVLKGNTVITTIEKIGIIHDS